MTTYVKGLMRNILILLFTWFIGLVPDDDIPVHIIFGIVLILYWHHICPTFPTTFMLLLLLLLLNKH